MSRGLNRIQLIGRLGRDPEMRYTAQGKAVTNFSLATGDKWTDRDGNERDDTEWFRIEAWDRLAEIANEYLKKGSQVYIEGRVKSRKYVDRDGIERTSIDVVASNLVFLGAKGDTGGGIGGYRSGGADEADGYEDEPPAAPRQARQAAPPARQPSSIAPARRNQPQPIEPDMTEEDIPF